MQILVNEEEDARLLDRCEAKRKEWAKHWQCDEEVQNVEDKSWKNEELRGYKAKTGAGCDGFQPRVSLGVHGECGTEWEMSATSMHDDVLPDSEECHK